MLGIITIIIITTTYWIFIKEEFEAHLELKCKDSYLKTWADSKMLCACNTLQERNESRSNALFFTPKNFPHL